MVKYAHILMLLFAGCAGPKAEGTRLKAKVEVESLSLMADSGRQIAIEAPAVVLPAKLMGPEWDHAANFDPLTQWYEVWATTDLNRPFTLKTNTNQTRALWPMQQQEFYMVRTADVYGQKSVWATTR